MDPIDVLGFDHVDLTVNDVERSQAFYEKVLGALGFRLIHATSESGSVIFANGHTSIAIRPPTATHAGAPFDRYRVGLHHLALRAARRADVDRFHAWLVEQGMTVLDPPAEYSEYGADYYAVFFADPDGLKLELVHFPWGYWKTAMTSGRTIGRAIRTDAGARPVRRDSGVTHPGIAFGPPRRLGRPTVSEIAERLLVGAYVVPDDFAWLRAQHGVTAIVCLQDDADLAARGLESAALAAAGATAGIGWHHLPVPDADVEALGLRLAAIVEHLADLLERGERVYLHCSAGFNRAPTAAIAYLHARRALDLDAATALVEERRSCQPYAESLRIFASARAR